MKKAKCMIPALFLCSLLLTLPASANSAQMYWSGVSATGTIVTDKNCPIVVESELLTFDIGEFPKEYYSQDAVDEYLAYDGRVTAQYTFYNPADYAVTATLVFPFGKLPEYSHFSNESIFGSDSDRYGITVNGEAIPATVRHTLSRYSFDVASDIPKLKDGCTEDEFYYPEMPVYCETLSVSGITEEKGRATLLLQWHGYSADKRTIIVEPQDSHYASFADKGGFSGRVHNGQMIKLWYFGEYHGSPEWTLYDGEYRSNTVSGTLEALGEAEEMTFTDFVMQGCTEGSGISQTDWYNARIDDLNNTSDYNDNLAFTRSDLIHRLLRWYQYEITIQPGERIVNTVTAPIYPSINTAYSPNIYNYTYLLSPAQTWSSFGALDIVVNTPFYITESGIEGFEKTDSGYTLSLDGLPEGELKFTMSKSKNPHIPINPAYIIVLFPFVVLLIGFVTAIILVAKDVKKRKGNSESR